MGLEIHEGEAVEVIDPGPSAKKPHTEQGEVLDLPQWVAHQMHCLLQYIDHIFSSEELTAVDRESVGGSLQSFHLQVRNLLVKCPRDSLVQRMQDLPSFPLRDEVLQDWIQRFATLFGVACKDDHLDVEHVQMAVERYQQSIVHHLQKLANIVHLHTGRSMPLPWLLQRVQTVYLGHGEDPTSKRRYLEFGTSFPYLHVVPRESVGDEGFRALLRANSPEIEALPHDDERVSLYLDFRPEHRFEDHVRIFVREQKILQS